MSSVMTDAINKAGFKRSINDTKKNNDTNKKRSVNKRRLPKNLTTMVKGTIKWFDLHKGYGFIVAEDGTEHFVYHSGIVLGRTYTGFEAGDEVEFRLTIDSVTNKTKAVNVMLTCDNGETSDSTDDAAEEDADTATDSE